MYFRAVPGLGGICGFLLMRAVGQLLKNKNRETKNQEISQHDALQAGLGMPDLCTCV